MAHALDRALDAAECLRTGAAARPDIAIFLAGSGAERANVEHRVAGQRLDNVRMIPRQPKDAMPALWSLCDLALIPLRDAPVFATVIPSKLFEAMGMGVPVLMALPDGEATGSVARTGCGVCVPAEDPRALATAVIALADDGERMAKLRAAAAAPEYSRERQAERMIQVLEGLVRRALFLSRRAPSAGDHDGQKT